eukprot:TRINITY_DN1491_c0_g1_i2.p1 TRINITY_DN1491_c0_g1~~TRINITY_DN1491_c0_g1_i2.p1  ORF type:complete len:115 (+),score=10.93 TRINITY_DN1491_c0_g1_i2:305-649(+)
MVENFLQVTKNSANKKCVASVKCFYCSLYLPRCLNTSKSLEFPCKSVCEEMVDECSWEALGNKKSQICHMFDDVNCIHSCGSEETSSATFLAPSFFLSYLGVLFSVIVFTFSLV